MDIANRIMVVTGGASGIGKALAEAFHREGARHVVIADRDEAGVKAVAEALGGTGIGLDVADEDAVRDLVQAVTSNIGPIDLFMSNAGYVTFGGLEVPNQEINDMWDVHVMSHVYAARAVLPSMIERGEGYIMSTASAAGLLTQLGSLAYSLTKHAAVALAEWIAITHGDQGIRVSVHCPQAVKTNIGANSPTAGRFGEAVGVGFRRRRSDRRTGGRRLHRSDPRGAVLGPAPSRGRGVRPPQGDRCRPLAPRQEAVPGPAVRRQATARRLVRRRPTARLSRPGRNQGRRR